MTATAWLVTTGSYSDYTVLAVTPSETEAQAYADAYNAARESQYREDAEVEEVEFWRQGDPLPRRITLWNGDDRRTWPITYVTTRVDAWTPAVRLSSGPPGRTVFVKNFPTEAAAREAVAEALGGAS